MPDTVLGTVTITVNKPDLFAAVTEYAFQTRDTQ